MGQHMAVVLDVKLPNRVHVYAPGVKGYIPVDWKPDDSAAIKSAPAWRRKRGGCCEVIELCEFQLQTKIHS